MCLILSFFLLQLYASLASDMQQFCRDSSDCSIKVGYTCQNSKCVCLQQPDKSSCIQVALSDFGGRCYSDIDCKDYQFLECDKESKTCRCRKAWIWNQNNGMCYALDTDAPFVNKKYDLTRDFVIPTVILATLACTGMIFYRLFCNRKSWRRRRRGGDMARALEEAQLPYVGTSQPATWIASYRFFGTVERSGPPCLLLPVGPPPYEEALKHKVILSSYHPPTVPLVETTPL